MKSRPRKRAAPRRGPAKSEKLWGGRFTQGADPAAERFTGSLAFDRRLWPHDVAGSVAWAKALARAGLLSAAERDAIVKGLAAVRGELEAAPNAEGTFREDADHPALLEARQRPAQRAHVRPIQVDRYRADVAMEHRVERRRAPDARHHEERDRVRHRHAEDDAVQIVVMVRRDEVRSARRKMLESVDAKIEPAGERLP